MPYELTNNRYDYNYFQFLINTILKKHYDIYRTFSSRYR